ncbi:MAG: acetyl-CoA carboxylase biotin carboxyl carrier protein subunit [Deltaproteobacteria bacterium]|nr:acetyl-CoA carboxylase biotin carboxyl carrier protein subunit [Deltaproteobacteria bacterium]
MNEDQDRLEIDGTFYSTEIPEGSLGKPFQGMPDPRHVQAIIPGTIVDISVKEGQAVAAGQGLITLETMKMRNEVEAEISGRIAKVFVSVGENVKKNQLMVTIDSKA